MDTFLRIDINLFATVFLVIVLFLAYQKLDHQNAFNRLFFLGCILIIAMNTFEAITCIINNQPALQYRVLSTLLHFFLFGFAPIITLYWYLLADSLTTYGEVRQLKAAWPLWLPIWLTLLLTLLSPLLHTIFYIDAQGVYHRGFLFPLIMTVSYSYLLSGFALLFKRKRNIRRTDFLFLTLFCLMPITGGLVQGFLYGVLLLWPSSACALAILYMYLQERMVQLDSLTGAWTRASFESYLTQRLRTNDRKPFGIIFLDIDNLKQINDLHGHNEGDAAIRAATQTIQSVLRKGDAIARLGGDEFAIVANLRDMPSLVKLVARIGKAITAYNQTADKPYALSLSMGADIFVDDAQTSVENILERVDWLMYADKRRKKGESSDPPSRRSTDAPANEG